MRTTLKNAKSSGTFVISPEPQLYGELTLDGAKTLLYLQASERFPTHGISPFCVKGVLHDLTKVSLFDCIAPREPSHVIRGSEQYYYLKAFPHFVASGDHHISPDEKAITSVHFQVDDATTLFCDHDAFGWLMDGSPFIDQIASANVTGRHIATGPDSQIAYFAGKREIFAADTAFGKISAFHDPFPSKAGPSGVHIENRIFVSIVFKEKSDFREAIFCTYRVIEYLGLLVGRPQNLLALHLHLTPNHKGPAGLDVYCSMFPERNSFGESEKPNSFDVLLDAVREPEEFSRVLEHWLDRQKDWHEARWRFFNSFARQRHYDVDRLIGSANMFDILPDSAVPDDVPLTEQQKDAQSASRRLFRALPAGPERDSVLGALGRMGKSSLKHKVRHRALLLVDSAGDRFPQLLKVTDEAVNCRNYYVHGGEPRFDYTRNFDLVTFFTETLEFVFAASDLIEAGWDVRSWILAPTSMSHPFGRYRVSYAASLQMLNAVLPEAIPAVAGGLPIT